jgi:hypothetical protein
MRIQMKAPPARPEPEPTAPFHGWISCQACGLRAHGHADRVALCAPCRVDEAITLGHLEAQRDAAQNRTQAAFDGSRLAESQMSEAELERFAKFTAAYDSRRADERAKAQRTITAAEDGDLRFPAVLRDAIRFYARFRIEEQRMAEFAEQRERVARLFMALDAPTPQRGGDPAEFFADVEQRIKARLEAGE